MPITFGCECGKQFTVADEFAGTRMKCPTCGSTLTVPTQTSEPEPAATVEPAPALTRRDPQPAAYLSWPIPTPPPPQSPVPKRPPRYAPHSPEDEHRPQRRASRISTAVPGGLLLMLIAVVWFVLGWVLGLIFFYALILFFFGLVTFVRGWFGYSED